jgi:hypothetical protein
MRTFFDRIEVPFQVLAENVKTTVKLEKNTE